MKKIIPAIMICILLFAGCGNPGISGDSISEDGPSAEQQGKDFKDQGSDPEEKKTKTNIDLNFNPNEAGKIMILMYHNIGNEEKEWVRTPANFLKDMEILYDKGYRPISLKDYVNGSITTEQGFTPVVITFDDGNLNNFEYLENGQIKEDSAVGLLMSFHENHKDFPLEATFFLDGEHPFRQNSLILNKLSFIVENGMDIGNHTKDHNSFKNAGKEEIQEQIGAEAQYLKSALNRDDYEINTLALPFGERPKDEAQARYLTAGSWNGVPYKNIAIVNVGWNPAYSPYDNRFDPASIPRIRASEMEVDHVGLYDYLNYFDKHREERFVSDGVAEIITVPENRKEFIYAPDDKEIYIYSPGTL